MKRSEWPLVRPISDTPEARTEAIKRSISHAIAQGIEWYCPFGCGFHRWAETKGGVLRIAGRHLREEHRIRLEIH